MTADAETGRTASPWDVALRLLGVRARSRHEMRERLLRRGFADDVVEDVMARLDRAGLLDDADFAAEWVRSRHAYSGRGRIALKQELRSKGIDAEVIDEALGDISPDAERVNAVSMATKKLAAMRVDLTDRAERDKAFRRLAGVLSRRGYDQSTVIDVVTEVLGTRS
ncbi:regulatory protein RecX [Gordonia sp. (in: high G+C Gram-positive bacteria)]|uniref:regulatory protein RecX n=1 Tax=Gordonia sp. (in: high G+C Gram-positive bacteria) TaxID=84139 RepID=UPI002619B236|nr:regulatory protein RecX [Gordonia sp. (in: high G+C Gram-positive bacteria)]HMS76198.1 regulatory protein RecX [Gordonia sp. (in: high G+C Gram-positive bacteria)]HQV17497.1 regulatory protein RecX [Gordonia sp. (in: high G+C Gram-positive bacteria)]